MDANIQRVAPNASKEDYRRFVAGLAEAAGFDQRADTDAQTLDFSEDDDEEDED